MTDEPRTHLDIMRDLLEFAQDHEWVDEDVYCGRGCNCLRGSHTICPECKAEKGQYGTEQYRQHEPGCRLHALILEAETYIDVEQQLEAERQAVA